MVRQDETTVLNIRRDSLVSEYNHNYGYIAELLSRILENNVLSRKSRHRLRQN